MADGIELASAYVTLIPSLKGAKKRIESDLASVDVASAGRKMGEKLGDSIGKNAGEDAQKGIEKGIAKADTKSAGSKLGSQLGSAVSDAFSGSFDASSVMDAIGEIDTNAVAGKFGSLGEVGAGALSKIAGAAPIAGAAVAAIGAVALDTATDFETAEARITAAVGGMGEESDKLMEAGQSLYEDGWGESMTDLSDSLINAREILGDLSEEDMSGAVEGALALEEVYGSDFSETLRGARVLMEKFGLSSTEAMDLITAGTQRGLDYTDELGDNLSEYAGRWGDAGLEASEYFSLLEAGVDGGAYSLDKVGDFLNEFLTSLSDGRMDEAIGHFSESTQKTFEDFKNGGADAQDVLDAVVGELAEMPDGYEKAQIASELWSSLGEDNAMSMIESLGNVEDTFGDVAGASEEMTEQVQDDLGSKWDSALRKWQDLLKPAGDAAADFFGGIADGFGGVADGISGFFDQQTNFGELTTYFDEMDTTLTNAMENMGYDVDYLKVKLSEAGIGMEELEQIGSGRLRSLASAFEGNTEQMIWALENYNKVPIIDKDGTVTIGDAELIDAQGRVWTWNGSELVDQDGNVAVEDQELIDAQGRIWVWNGSSLIWQNTGVSVDTSSIDAATAKWSRADFGWKTTGVSVNFSAGSTKLTGNVTGASRLAEGGVLPDASSSGFIATGPTFLDGGSTLVGEAGAEAIVSHGGSRFVVPLTNKTYSAPFADVIAQQVSKYLGGGSRGGSPTVVNVTVDGNGTSSRVETIVLALLDQLEKEARL